MYVEVVSLRRRVGEYEVKLVEVPEGVTCHSLRSVERSDLTADILVCTSSKPFYLVLEICDTDQGICTRRVAVAKRVYRQDEVEAMVRAEAVIMGLRDEEIREVLEALRNLGL